MISCRMYGVTVWGGGGVALAIIDIVIQPSNRLVIVGES